MEEGRTRFIPENWAKTYFEWMRNIKDWCVSRQIWWGHRIPAWYDAQGNVYVGRSEAEVRNKHPDRCERALKQETTCSTRGSPPRCGRSRRWAGRSKTPELARFYPTNVLVTGFDIIFFWVARMMMMGLKFMGDVPFRDVYITGLIRDEHGDKMSKSKGNVIDPLDIVDGIGLEALVAKRTSGMMQPQLAAAIEKSTRKQFPEGIAAHGTDALRFTLAALASPSRDLRFDLGRVGGYRNFCNKLWNCGALRGAVGGRCGCDRPGPVEYSMADRWIRSRFGQTIVAVENALRDYRFDFAATALYEFTWYEFCDWYLELTKPVLQSESVSAELKRGTRKTLVEILEALQRALHPLMPFITEEIWQGVRHSPAARARPSCWPAIRLRPTIPLDAVAEKEIAWVQAVVLGVRQIRGEMNIKPAKLIPVLLRNASAQDQEYAERHRASLEKLAGLESITVLPRRHASRRNRRSPWSASCRSSCPWPGSSTPPPKRSAWASSSRRPTRTWPRRRRSSATRTSCAMRRRKWSSRSVTRIADLERTVTNLTAQLERVRRLFEP